MNQPHLLACYLTYFSADLIGVKTKEAENEK